MVDAHEKGRLEPPLVSFFGEENPAAKITEDEVREIKGLLSDGSLSQGRIATRYGVSQSTVSKIHLGKVWAHV